MKLRERCFSRTNLPVLQTTFFNWKSEDPSFLEELRKLNPPLRSCLYKRGAVPTMTMMILGLYLLNRTTGVTISSNT